MSGGRKDWSALSSLAKQWTLEDEEERERERRRRQRNLSSGADDEAPRLAQNGGRPAAERLPKVEETEVPKPRPPAPKDDGEDVQAILRTRQERRQRRQAVEVAQAPIRERLGAEEGRDSSDPVQAKQQPVASKKEVDVPPRRRLSREQRGPWAKEEESLAGREPAGGQKGVLEKSPLPEKPPALEKRLGSEETSVSERKSLLEKTAASEKKPVVEKISISEKPPAPRTTSGSQKGLVSEKASIFEKSPASETKLAPKRAAPSEQPQAPVPPAASGSQSATKEPEPRTRAPSEKSPLTSATKEPEPRTRAPSEKSPLTSATKEPEPRTRAPSEKSPLTSAEPGAPSPPTVASRLPPITLQVKIPIKEEEDDVFPPTPVTYSSSLQRSSPRTISFRMSPRKYNSEAPLTRSASVRLPARSVKLCEKLERYHTAIQRSESIKSLGPSRTEFFVAPVGVASKRHLFEKELAGQSRADPASSRKENLKLSGVVTSRLNLWISRTQESGDQDPQEVTRETAAAKRTQRGKKADPSLDAEV